MENNNVASFFYYMWNAWSKEECKIAFASSNCGWCHLWQKWCQYYEQQGFHGAISIFFANLSENNQDLLAKRALQVYNRKSRII